MNVHKGMRFKHSRVINWEDKSPAIYQVTKIANGQAYYRPVYDLGIVGSERLGKPECCLIADFDRVCLEQLNTVYGSKVL